MSDDECINFDASASQPADTNVLAKLEEIEEECKYKRYDSSVHNQLLINYHDLLSEDLSCEI